MEQYYCSIQFSALYTTYDINYIFACMHAVQFWYPLFHPSYYYCNHLSFISRNTFAIWSVGIQHEKTFTD